MSEKNYSLLPTTAEQADTLDTDAPNHASQQETHRRNRRTGFLKLGLFALAFYMLFWPIDQEDNDNDKTPSHHRHHNKKHGCISKSKYTFESHMQSDIDQLVAGSLESSIVWDRLAEMTDTYGNRIAGSAALEKSIDWIVAKAKADGLDVTTEDVVVDYWERNEESLYFLSPTRGPVKLHMLGLGFSVPTPDPINGLEAEVVVVRSKEELEELGEAGQLKGRIVLFNKKFESYGADVPHRTYGATWAQEHGAVAVLVRSIAPFSLQTPHAGNSLAAKIPAASITAEDAELLARSLKRHQENPKEFPEWPKVKLAMNAKTELKSRTSRNIIIELKGREAPEEVIAVGGHIDSWDVGSGAVDDGAGTFIAWETLRQLSKLERPPRRTVRAVFWTSEENGSPGGRVYAANHPETNSSRHVFAFESDSGVFDPYGIRFTGGRHNGEEDPSTESFDFMAAAGEHFLASREDLGYPGAGHYILPNGSGADIAPLCRQGVACAQFVPADPFPLTYSTSPYAAPKPVEEEEEEENAHHRRHGRHHRKHSHHGKHELDQPRRPIDGGYFYYHHTEADNMNAFTPDQVKNSVAVMAIWTYIVAESRVEL
ncbi:hypothetical protein BGZ59_001611 [Podila verticillata]|nr:hypothetical protein BGZ59_001611 [Podila verticillata]KFH73716.1 hypothetical protein MVEG_00930 [Podila verticillata NRRL 6337]